MYLFIIIISICLGICFLVSLVFFIRSLILKKNIGCGLLSFFTIIVIVIIVFFHSEIISYQSENEFIRNFEENTDLSYPHSGKIIEKKHQESLSFFGDYRTAAIIKMDTIDYKKILQTVRTNKNFVLDCSAQKNESTPSLLLNKKIAAGQFDCVYKMNNRDNCYLWFHMNKEIIVYEDIKN